MVKQVGVKIEMNQASVSVIIPNYNYEKYILESLSSVLNQSLKPIECIIVDDASTDSSPEIIQEFINNNLNSEIKFSFIRHKENKGQIASSLTGFQACKGVFMTVLDADDIWDENFLKYSIEAHLNQKAAFVFCDYHEIGEQSELLAKNCFFGSPKQKTDNDLILYTLSKKPIGGWHWSPTSCVVFRRKALEYFTNINTQEWLMCADTLIFNYAHLIGDSLYLNKPLMYYRLHKKNGSGVGYPTGNVTYTSKLGREKIDRSMSKIILGMFEILIDHKDELFENLCGIENRIVEMIKPMPLKVYKKYYKQVKTLLGAKLANKFLKKKILQKLFGSKK